MVNVIMVGNVAADGQGDVSTERGQRLRRKQALGWSGGASPRAVDRLVA
jgi:hypothetical protein